MNKRNTQLTVAILLACAWLLIIQPASAYVIELEDPVGDVIGTRETHPDLGQPNDVSYFDLVDNPGQYGTRFEFVADNESETVRYNHIANMEGWRGFVSRPDRYVGEPLQVTGQVSIKLSPSYHNAGGGLLTPGVWTHAIPMETLGLSATVTENPAGWNYFIDATHWNVDWNEISPNLPIDLDLPSNGRHVAGTMDIPIREWGGYRKPIPDPVMKLRFDFSGQGDGMAFSGNTFQTVNHYEFAQPVNTPEPSSAAMIFGGFLSLLGLRRWLNRVQ